MNSSCSSEKSARVRSEGPQARTLPGGPFSLTEWRKWSFDRKLAWLSANIEVRIQADLERYLRQIEDMIDVSA